MKCNCRVGSRNQGHRSSSANWLQQATVAATVGVTHHQSMTGSGLSRWLLSSGQRGSGQASRSNGHLELGGLQPRAGLHPLSQATIAQAKAKDKALAHAAAARKILAAQQQNKA